MKAKLVLEQRLPWKDCSCCKAAQKSPSIQILPLDPEPTCRARQRKSEGKGKAKEVLGKGKVETWNNQYF
ncbi:MAG: hypothetical protein AB9861_12395 [Methanosarcina sp.]